MIICQSIIEKDLNTGERHYHYHNLSILFRGKSRTPGTYKMEIFVIIVIASSQWLLSQRGQILNAVGILDPPMPKVSRLMVSNCFHE